MTADRFALRLKELRAAAGLTQRQLAERAGMAEAGVRNLEQGRTGPTWESVVALAEALDVPTDSFRQEPAPTTQKPPPGRPRKRAQSEGEQPAQEEAGRAVHETDEPAAVKKSAKSSGKRKRV
jgi:transcriptional regulator with XRE-family HTH domain